MKMLIQELMAMQIAPRMMVIPEPAKIEEEKEGESHQEGEGEQQEGERDDPMQEGECVRGRSRFPFVSRLIIPACKGPIKKMQNALVLSVRPDTRR